MAPLLRIDTRSGDVVPLQPGFKLPIKSCTGLAHDLHRIYVVCTDGAHHAYLSVLSRKGLAPLFVQALPELTDPHSILVHQGRLYVACTGRDAVLACDILPDGIADPETIWSAHGGSAAQGRDTHHVNSIALWNGDLVISAFGPKEGPTWSSATKGYLYNLTQRLLIADNLCQPHSLRTWRGELYYCESARGKVVRFGRDGRKFDAYARGLDMLDDGLLAFGTSVARRQSKSLGVILNPADPGEASGSCGIGFLRLDQKAESNLPATIALDRYGTEIYDLLRLDDDRLADFEQSQPIRPSEKNEPCGAACAVSARCTVIVPVYDAFDELLKCLQSLKKHLPAYANLVVVDDASSDGRIAPLLARLRQEWPVPFDVVTQAANRGFPAAVNAGIEHCGSAEDVVILNSDTVVTAGWLDRLREAFDQQPSAGIACPLSNNGTILSVPRFNQSQELPAIQDADSFGASVASAARGYAPVELPTAVGFCMYVRRAVIDAIGLIDPVFGRGYGEECDYSMRARQTGFGIVCAPSAFVYHRGESSFGHSHRTAVAKQVNQQILYARWPAYQETVISFCRENPLRPVCEAIWRDIQQARSGARPGVLHVLHRGGNGGGVENHVRDLSLHCRNWSPQTVVLPRVGSARWSDLEEIDYSDGVRTVGLCLNPPGPGGAESDAELRFARFLRANSAQIVHFHHLIGWNSLNLPAIAKRAGKAVVISIHDYAYLCPNYNFARDNGTSCKKSFHMPGDAECERCLARFEGNEDVGRLKPARGQSVIGKTREIFALADAIIFPSEFALRRHRAAIGRADDNKTFVIPHSAITNPPYAGAAPGSAAPLVRVTFFGAFNFAKGADLFIAAARRLSGKGFVFNIVGSVYHSYQKAVDESQIPFSGSYDRDELPALLSRTDVVCILSRWDETYCLAFDEAMASGKIVIASAVGALRERFTKDEFSFLIDPNQYQTLIDTLLQIQRTQLHARLPAPRGNPIAVTDSPYLQLYRTLVPGRAGAIESPAPAAWQKLRLAQNDYADLIRARQLEAASGGPAMPHGCEAQIDCLIDCGALPESVAATESNLKALGAASVHLIDSGAGINLTLPRLTREWVLMIQAGDRLADDFFEVIEHSVRDADAALVYWDEDLRSERAVHYQALHKPPFDPLLLANRPDLLADCALVKRRALVELGGIDRLGSVALARCAVRLAHMRGEQAIRHIPRICSHRFDVRHWEQIRGGVLNGQPDAAPPKNAARRPTVRVLLLIRDTNAISPNLADQYLNQQQVRVSCIEPWLVGRPVAAAQGFNHPRIAAPCSAFSAGAALREAAKSLTEDFLLVCAAAISVPGADFLAGLIARMGLHDGIAGPGIVEPDGKLFSSGVLLGGGRAGVATFLGNGAAPGESGQFGLLHEDRHVGALAEDFVLIRRDTLRAVPFDADFEHHYTLVDFCIRARQIGWQSLCAGSLHAMKTASPSFPDQLSKQQALASLAVENERMLAKWGEQLAHDPTHNSNLALQSPIPALDLRFAVTWNGKPKTRLRVVAAPFDNWGSGTYRVALPLAELRTRKNIEFISLPGHSSGYMPSVSELRRAEADVLLIHNPFHDYQIEALRAYKAHLPIRIVAGMDDLLTELPAYNPYAKTIYPDLADRMRRAFALCDRLVVSTEALKRAYAGLIDRIEVIPNAIDPDAWPDSRTTGTHTAKLRVGWAGANQHGGDLSLISELVRSTRDAVEWVFLGMRPEGIGDEAESHPMVSFADYPARLAGLRLDLAVAPLLDNAFNRAKSNLKLLEYGMCEIPVLCSDLTPYRDAPVWRVSNQANAWRDMLLKLVAQPDTLTAAGKTLRAWVLSNHSIKRRTDQWLSAFG